MTPFSLRLELWLADATTGLSRDSNARVRAEITEHYASALTEGLTPEQVVSSLGDPYPPIASTATPC